MKRNAVTNLIEWKESGTTVPFLLVGTKGTGKTYLAMEFATAYYPQFLYVNFELNKSAKCFFEEKLSVGDSLSEVIAAYFQMDERYLSELIVILDEISYCPMLWTALTEPVTIPLLVISGLLPSETDIISSSTNSSSEEIVEKSIENIFWICRLFPLGFDEFLSAVGSDWYIDIIQGHFQNIKPVPDIVHQELLALFEEFLIVGGMPAAVNEYISSKSIYNVSEVHSMVKCRMQSVLDALYEEKDSGKGAQVLQVLPEQLKKENKKFRFNLIRKGVTYSLYKESIDALVQCGMVLRINEQKKESHFKLYLPDVGMLSSAFCGEDSEEIKKALLENYVMQTLVASGIDSLCFWESEAQAKVDFILVRNNCETPVELRTSIGGKAKSIASYQAANGKSGEHYYRFGFENFYSTSVLTQIPYYAVFCIK